MGEGVVVCADHLIEIVDHVLFKVHHFYNYKRT
jgi:hypothetical protein